MPSRRSRSKAGSRGGSESSFGALPRIVWMHPDYCHLSGSAVKLLMDLVCQYNGRNNGNLTVAYSVLKRRGWKSKQTISSATHELLDANLIVQTREGYFTNPGGRCALYAITWKAIDECPGKNLTLRPTSTPFRKFTLEAFKSPGPDSGPSSVHKVGPKRVRDSKGRYVSVHNVGRFPVAA